MAALAPLVLVAAAGLLGPPEGAPGRRDPAAFSGPPPARGATRTHPPSASTGPRPAPDRPRPPRAPRFRRYLSRPILEGPHHLPHGVLEATASAGVPHVYQVGLGLGLLDHLTVRLRAHAWPGPRPVRIAPDVALAVLRGRFVAAGLRYHMQIERPPPADGDPDTPSFERRIHVLAATFAAGTRFVSAGVEVGWARGRIVDPKSPTPEALVQRPVTVDRLAGGVDLRVGTRRFGFFARALFPFLVVDAGIDLRFGLFEVPPRSRRRRPEHPVRTTPRWWRR